MPVRIARILGCYVKVEGGVGLVFAKRVGSGVAAASAAERLAPLPARHRRRRRELLLCGDQARVGASLRLDRGAVRGGLVGADVPRRARAAVHAGPTGGARVRPGRVRYAVRAVGGVRAVRGPRHGAVLARRVGVIVRVLALCMYGADGRRAVRWDVPWGMGRAKFSSSGPVRFS